jgi:hypothetical protein
MERAGWDLLVRVSSGGTRRSSSEYPISCLMSSDVNSRERQITLRQKSYPDAPPPWQHSSATMFQFRRRASSEPDPVVARLAFCLAVEQ